MVMEVPYVTMLVIYFIINKFWIIFIKEVDNSNNTIVIENTLFDKN